MEQALKNRLKFGSMMLIALFALLWFDDAAQRWTRDWMMTRYQVRGGVGGLGLLIILSLINPLAIDELAVLFTAEKVRPYRGIASVGAFLIVLHAFLTQFPPFRPIAASSFAFVIVLVMLAAALSRALRQQTQEAITRMAGTVLASMYFGGLSWFIMAIRVKHSAIEGGFHGTTWVVLSILLMVKSTDIGAYFGGRALGRHKLIPWLSPGKTWEGLGCGLVTAGIVGLLCSLKMPQVPWDKGFIFGVLIGGIGQLGDLLESMMKRDAEVKDSGKLVPGFGGILDIIDSPLLAAPFAYLLFSLF